MDYVRLTPPILGIHHAEGILTLADYSLQEVDAATLTPFYYSPKEATVTSQLSDQVVE